VPLTPETAWEQARGAWPAFAVDKRDFVKLLRGRDDLTALHLGDLYLAFACAKGDRAALKAFELVLRPLVNDAVGRALQKEPAFVEDVLQALHERLLVTDAKGHARILDFSGTGSLAGWLRQAAVRTALNMQKSSRRDAPLDEAVQEGLVGASDDPELEVLKRRCRKELKSAIQGALKALEPGERELLRLNLLESESIDKLAERLNVSRATAARRLIAVRARLLELTRAQLRERLDWTDRQLNSVVGLVRSQLDLSLYQHLK
jgi:RNA polymerase sigma-70 factor, ECF subfamily